MDNEHPVTRVELKEVLAEFRQDLVTKTELRTVLGEFKTELKTEIVEELTDRMRQIETNLLTAFHSYARVQNTRLHTMDVVDQEVRARVAVLEERLLAVEARLPPSH